MASGNQEPENFIGYGDSEQINGEVERLVNGHDNKLYELQGFVMFVWQENERNNNCNNSTSSLIVGSKYLLYLLYFSYEFLCSCKIGIRSCGNFTIAGIKS